MDSRPLLRPGLPTDADEVAAMHERCSPRTLFARYHAGTRTIPRRLLHRLLMPPRGRTILGVTGQQVVALGQLITTTNPDVAEISLLVEDSWQGRGIGSALLGKLAATAHAAGHRELIGWCLPGERGLVRTAARCGLHTETGYQDALLRVTVTPAQGPLAVSSSPRS
jgi:GNAT superfamily N-acetyltransferase